MLLALLEKVILGFLIQRFLDGRWTICHREIGPVRAFQLCTKRAVSSELEGKQDPTNWEELAQKFDHVPSVKIGTDPAGPADRGSGLYNWQASDPKRGLVPQDLIH